MIINLVETDPSDANASASVKAAWQQAANIIGSMFTDNITININVTYGVFDSGGSASAWPGTQDQTNTTVGQYLSYQTVYNNLTQHASPGDSTFAALPNATSIGGQSQVAVFNSQLKAMGIISATGGEIDGSADFGTGIPLSNMVGVALHELTHAMGRVPWGVPFSPGAGDTDLPDIFDLFRFTSVGNRFFDGNFKNVPSAYFSLNNGLSEWATYGTTSDDSDTFNGSLTPGDPFNEFYNGSTLQYLTPFDLEQMDALGFHLKEDAPASGSYDFNGDNSADILLQSSSGRITYGSMAGGAFQGWVNLPVTQGYNVVGEGKIAGGVDSDVVVENANGQVLYGKVVNGAFSNWVQVTNSPGFNVVGVGDINRDHYADVVVQNPTTSQILYANMSNGVFNNWVQVANPTGWKVDAVADINGDGFDDIVVQNPNSGQMLYANMANGVFNGWGGVASSPGFSVVGAGDINRDGFADIVVENFATGEIDYANMVNGMFNGWVHVTNSPGWKVAAVEDVVGNGFDDIVVQNSSTGQILYANMTTGIFQGWVAVGTTPGYTALSQPGPAGAAASGITMSDSTPMDDGFASGVSASVPGTQNGSITYGIAVSDPGPQDSSTVTGFAVYNPAGPIGGVASAVTMLDPGSVSGDYGHTANWLTHGLLPGGMSNSNNQDTGAGVGGIPVVTADNNLQNLLKLGS